MEIEYKSLLLFSTDKTSLKVIKRHVQSKKHLNCTSTYKVNITGLDFNIKTKRGAKPCGDAGGVRTLEHK